MTPNPVETKMTSAVTRKIAAATAVLGLATIGTAAVPRPANAWWNHYGYGWGVGVYVPPVVVAPPPTYYPAPAYYAPPARAWIPAHWHNGYWVPGHWS
jgi:hypothetical protein